MIGGLGSDGGEGGEGGIKNVIKRSDWLSRKGLVGCGEGVSLEEGGEECGFDSNENEVVPKVNDVSLVDRVFDGAFGRDGDEDFFIGERVVVSSSS
nr:hypothetical protein [Tanacetum cinerariifolium]